MGQAKIRVGIVGPGRIAGMVHLPSLKLCPERCDVVAVASRTEEKAKAFAAQWAIPRVYTDWKALFADPDLDAVVLCPPSGLTATMAKAAVAAGKHVLCEKPLGLTYADAREVEAATAGSARIHMVAFTFRFVPALRYLKRLVAEGHFGEIRHWRMSYFTDFMLDPAAPVAWRNQRAQAGAGILADMGSHGIDFARYLLGDIVAVSGASRLYVRQRPSLAGGALVPVDADDACAFTVEFASGAIGTFDFNRAVAGRGGTGRANYQCIEIHGTGGAAVYELIHPFELQISLGPAMTRTQQWARAEVPLDLRKFTGSPRNPRVDDPLLGYKLDQGVAFLRAIAGETQEYPTFHDGAEAQKVVDAVEDAVRERRWVVLRK
ncbi:MAG: dehydrogenase [candidate division NC10 bacterium]|nr:dehydrogenase [candidate division NC10 bacterium]